MAAAAMDAIIFSDIQPQCLSAESNVSCANCILVKEQLHTALLELKSARTIISLLRDDINKATAPDASSIPKPSPRLYDLWPSLSCESSVCEQAGDKWIPVVHNFTHTHTQKVKTPTVTSIKTDQPIMSSNRFTPLSNLN
jgi:hypothetical protein